MQGWNILSHSVRLVFTNIDAALKISLVPYAISALAFLFFGLPALAVLEAGTPQAMMEASAGVWLGQIAYLVISIIVALWIAVAWHRYVLLEEYPTSWVPQFHGRPMVEYFKNGFLIGVLIVALVLVAGMAIGLLTAWMGPMGLAITGLAVTAIASYVFYRLCPVLPAAAVGKPMRFGEAWDATSGAAATIAVLVGLVVVASYVMQLPATFGGANSPFGIAYSLIVNWLSMLIGVSVLTTFYGHFIEGRAID